MAKTKEPAIEIMKARGIRFADRQWKHLEKMAGKHGTPSDYNRKLVDDDIAKQSKKGKK